MPSSPAPDETDAGDLPENYASELRVALFRTTRRIKQQRGDVDLSEGQHAVLTTLCKHGRMSPGALAAHERVRPPSMTRIVNTLEGLGLVGKAENPDDRRQVVVELTDAGHELIVQTRRRRDAWLTVQLDALPAADRATLRRASEILLEVAGR